MSSVVYVPTPLPGRQWRDILEHYGYDIDTASTEVDPSRHCATITQLCNKWGPDEIGRLPSGFVISNFAVGFDNIDLDAARSNGVAVCNCPGVLTAATADLAVSLTLSAARRITEADRFVREGKWDGASFDVNRLLGKRLRRRVLGVVGAGRIGGDYAVKMCLLHAMDVVYFNRSPNESLESRVRAACAYHASTGVSPAPTVRRCASLAELLRCSDVVSLHCPLTNETRGLIGKEELALMKPTAILVNTARGPVVDESALADHLVANPSFAAGLDVFEKEPKVEPRLAADCDNVVLAPHIGSATLETRSEMGAIAALNVVGVLKGWPEHSDTGDMSPFFENPEGGVDAIPCKTPSVLVSLS